MAVAVFKSVFCLFFIFSISYSKEVDKDEVDKIIEDEITTKLSQDLLQSIEKKFYVDLERAVDQVLNKIKLLLHNGTSHIQERLAQLQHFIDTMRNESEEVDTCLMAYQNETTALAEKALHQMVVCGYALIGHDPAQAVRSVVELKTMIRHGLKPVHDQRQEIHDLLKVCGHDHDSLKSVIKCVIAKSPQLKSSMMTVSGKLIDGIVRLTKQMAHGAMHEACLIEVINTVEEEAFVIINRVKNCTHKNMTDIEFETNKFVLENNATVLDINTKARAKVEVKDKDDLKTLMKDTMIDTSNNNKEIKHNITTLQNELIDDDHNDVMNEVKHTA